MADEDVDASLCRYMTRMYVAGEQSNAGDYLLAALLHHRPEFGKWGSRKHPRAWRALRGWRKATPPRSRSLLARQIWTGIIWELARRGEWQMGLYVLTMVTTYLRPSEPLRIRRSDFVAPVH